MAFAYHIVKDRVCLIYVGHCPEYLVQLRLARPSIEAALPGINITVRPRAEYRPWLAGEQVVVDSEYQPEDYGHTFTITYDALRKRHPIHHLLVEAGIPIRRCTAGQPVGEVAYIVAHGDFPTASLSERDVERLKVLAARRGFRPQVVDVIAAADRLRQARQAGMVLGVESDMLFEAAGLGTPTVLVPTGVGTDLYQALAADPVIV